MYKGVTNPYLTINLCLCFLPGLHMDRVSDFEGIFSKEDLFYHFLYVISLTL